jgi:general stress protein 26
LPSEVVFFCSFKPLELWAYCVNAEPDQHLYRLIRDFKVAMLVSHAAGGGLNARPLAVAEVSADGDIVFATSIASPKVAEIAAEQRVLVAFQSGSAFATVAGRARISRDRQRLAALWSESWRLFYPGGIEDPSLCLLEVTPSAAEYWDNSGIKSLKYLFKGAKAYLLGERLDTDQAHAHAKLDLS